MGDTQPYSSPDLEAGDKKDPALQPVTPEAGDKLTQGAAGPRSTFDSNIGRIRATTPGNSRVMDDACGSASRVQRPQ